MKALLLLLLFYLMYKLVRPLFSRGFTKPTSNQKKQDESIKRYYTKGENIEEADFEEIQ